MLKLLILMLSIGITLMAKTEVTAIVGGGGSSMYGGGNIDGVGIAAAVYQPRAVAKSSDNQLLVGDKHGLKKVDIQNNSISTLSAFENAQFHDIEVDSQGNIYAGVTVFVDTPDADSCNGSQYSFFDSRIYKFSSAGEILKIWSNACENSDIDFEDFPVYLALDDADNLYAISSWTPEPNNHYGSKSTIRKVNSDGTLSDYLDVTFENEPVTAVQELEYHNGTFYLCTLGAAIYQVTPPSGELQRLYLHNDNGPYGIEFDSSEHIYVAYGSGYNAIQQGFFHEESLYLADLAGTSDLESPHLRPDDARLYEGVDALSVAFFGIAKVAKIGNDLFFADNYYHRVLKITTPSNEAPTLESVDFPSEINKNRYVNFKFKAFDNDGFVSRVLCDFDDGNGEQSIFRATSKLASSLSSSIIKSLRYTEDGSYTISCRAYDNEWLSSPIWSKSFTIGEVSDEPVITPSSASFENTIWRQKDQYNPAYPPQEQADGSIVLPFAPWTNGRLGEDGYYDGNAIVTRNQYDLRGQKVQLKFSLDGANNYLGALVVIRDAETGLPYQYLSTDHQWGPTKLVDANRAIYYQMKIEDNGSYALTYSYNGYGQSDIYQDQGVLTPQQQTAAGNAYVSFQVGDNYGGVNASATLYEFKIESLEELPYLDDYQGEDEDDSGGGALGYLLPLLVLGLLLFRRDEA